MVFGTFERMVAGRYLRARRQERLISVIALFSLLGIMLGVATLIIVMSVMNGFRADLMSKVLGLSGELSAFSVDGKGLAEFDALAAKVRSVPGVTAVTPLVEGQVLASSDRSSQGAKLRGERMEDLKGPLGIGRHILSGSIAGLDDGAVAMGYRLASSLGLHVDDHVTLLSPKGMEVGGVTSPEVRRFRVAAIFNTDMPDYDSAFLYTTLAGSQGFFHLSDRVTQLEISIANADEVELHERPVAAALGDGIRLFTWKQTNSALFGAIGTERTVMFIILTLIIVVAAFNVISSMMMLVKDKGRDIAILRTMGATSGMVLRIFFMTGSAVGVVGTVCGLGLGWAFCRYLDNIRHALAQLQGTELFNATIAFLSQIPVRMDERQVVAIVMVSLALSFLATVYPAWRAARLDPVEALRYE
ncbi:MAG TPA: lipoprotein-releasing ABC transporter permease subunit [Stellaceae bacterium]|nr:lipoprotein-releasing ABC transporter permease subunit [Stellaceae bacterium]